MYSLQRSRMLVCARAYVRACVRSCVRACVRAYVRAFVRALWIVFYFTILRVYDIFLAVLCGLKMVFLQRQMADNT